MKIVLIFLFSLLFAVFGFSQKSGNPSFKNQIQKLNATSSFKVKAIKAYEATKNDCWETDDIRDCTDLKDPWEDDDNKTPPSDTTSTRITAFYAFEKEISGGKGGVKLPSNVVNEAWKRNPGYSLKAMRNRIQYYSLKIGDQ
ncbi:MAG: hypothetical protein SFU99_16980 [Saprospiraceae bacterium]|nr:hypothetical protein [Saprospiraceae bacterium]